MSGTYSMDQKSQNFKLIFSERLKLEIKKNVRDWDTAEG